MRTSDDTVCPEPVITARAIAAAVRELRILQRLNCAPAHHASTFAGKVAERLVGEEHLSESTLRWAAAYDQVRSWLSMHGKDERDDAR